MRATIREIRNICGNIIDDARGLDVTHKYAEIRGEGINWEYLEQCVTDLDQEIEKLKMMIIEYEHGSLVLKWYKEHKQEQ